MKAAKAGKTKSSTGKNDRGETQREDAIESRDKALAKRSEFRATLNTREKFASMRQEHPKSKYRKDISIRK